MAKFNFDDIAKSAIKALGGKSNIKKVFNCVSRLRAYVKDDKKVDKKLIKNIDMSKGYNFNAKQHQIIFGTGTVNKVMTAINKILKNDINNKIDNKDYKEPYWNKKISILSNVYQLFRRGIRGFADIFIPLIPILIVGGLSLALSSFVGSFIPNEKVDPNFKSSAAYDIKLIFDIIGGAILGSLPVFVGYSTAKKFGGTPLLGAAVGLTLVSSNLLNAWTSDPDAFGSFLKHGEHRYFFEGIFGGQAGLGWFEKIGYQAQAIPTILIVGLMVQIEKLLTKIVPNMLYLVIVPLVSVFLTFFLGMWLIGPIGREISSWFGLLLKWVKPSTNNLLAGFILMIIGFMYAPIVVTGFHQGLGPIEFQVVAQAHGEPSTYLTPIATISNLAQGAAALVVVFIVSNKLIKNVGAGGAISAFGGITEPAMFGVNIRLIFPMLAAMIASSVGGFWIGVTKTLANSPGSASWIGIAVGQWDWFKTSDIGISHALTQIIGNVFTTLLAGGITFALAKTKWGKKQILALG